MDKINVMVVDGSAKAGELIKSILTQLGFKNVFIANDGFQGVKLIRETRIDMIFTDWELFLLAQHTANDAEIKPVNGAQFVKRLRLSEKSPNPFVSVVMLLRSVNRNGAAEARDAGVNEVVLKPFSAGDLCAKIIQIIDLPRIFVIAKTYKGPCRRIGRNAQTKPKADRRKQEIRLFRLDEHPV